MRARRCTWPSASPKAIPSWRQSGATNATSHARCSRSLCSDRARSNGHASPLDTQKGVHGMTFNLPRRLVAEALGTGLLVATVVGSGIMAENLAGGNVALALLGNT